MSHGQVRLANTIEVRALELRDRLWKVVDLAKDEVREDKWDGSELLLAPVLMMIDICSEMKITPEALVALMKRMEIPVGREHNLVKLIQPDRYGIGR